MPIPASNPSCARLNFRSHLDRPSDWQRDPTSPMEVSHHGMEINFLERGSVSYLFGGSIITIPEGRLTLFWGITPHQIIASSGETRLHWMEIPLALFLQWRLSDPLVGKLMAGHLITETDPAWRETDRAAFHRWDKDLESGGAEAEKIVSLEVEARLRRLAITFSGHLKRTTLPGCPEAKNLFALQKISRMAAYVAAHYTEPLRLAQVAQQAGFRPDYATTLFKKVSGLSIMDYVVQHRVAHAQRLLLTTNSKILDIALQAGFGSSSRFYEAFLKWCGQSPHDYRQFRSGNGYSIE